MFAITAAHISFDGKHEDGGASAFGALEEIADEPWLSGRRETADSMEVPRRLQ